MQQEYSVSYTLIMVYYVCYMYEQCDLGEIRLIGVMGKLTGVITFEWVSNNVRKHLFL
jgi:hypothetical protein